VQIRYNFFLTVVNNEEMKLLNIYYIFKKMMIIKVIDSFNNEVMHLRFNQFFSKLKKKMIKHFKRTEGNFFVLIIIIIIIIINPLRIQPMDRIA
jgi:hypothetical protein